MHHTYKPHGVCSTQIDFDLADDGTVTNVVYTGGCNGNLKAVGLLVDGMKADEIVEKLGGLSCGRRSTSCSDQLAKALKNESNDRII